MLFRLNVIYDDRVVVPLEIEEIIGASRFSDILRRRRSLGEEIRREIVEGGCLDFFHISQDQDADFLRAAIQDAPADRLYLRLPSCLMPTLRGRLAGLVAQAIYAPGSTLLAPPQDGEAPALLQKLDILPLLRPYDPVTFKDFFFDPVLREHTRADQCGFVDLRRPDQFLAFMGGATEPRQFNATRADRWTLRKSSTDREKMAAEYHFFHVVPETLKPFLLPTFDFIDDGKHASYAMERLAVPDVALQFIHHAFDENSFGLLVNRFVDFLRARPRRADGAAAVRENARASILGKMEKRLDKFLSLDIGRKLNAILASAGPAGSLENMRARASQLISTAINSDSSDYLAIGHGDPCFSNILFDRRTSVMRLIDPRGATSLDKAWAHPLYDLAKISHSVLGGYDFINNDLFDCVVDSNLKLKLFMQDGGPPAWSQTLFLDRIAAAGFPIKTIRAYELSLFMSMLPLHIDHKQKLLGFALVSCEIMNTIEAMP